MKTVAIKLFAMAMIGSFSISDQVESESFKDYDEAVVRAYKKVQIKSFCPHLKLDKNSTKNEVDKALKDYLVKQPFYKKHLKNKPGIFLYDMVEVGDSMSINRIYWIKNPEKYLFTLDKNTDRKILKDRSLITEHIADNISTFAILSEKIEKKDRSFLRKTASGSYNGFLNLMILTPKLGLGYIINPPMKWMKTSEPKDIYNDVTSEIEVLSIGEKDFLDISCIK